MTLERKRENNAVTARYLTACFPSNKQQATNRNRDSVSTPRPFTVQSQEDNYYAVHGILPSEQCIGDAVPGISLALDRARDGNGGAYETEARISQGRPVQGCNGGLSGETLAFSRPKRRAPATPGPWSLTPGPRRVPPRISRIPQQFRVTCHLGIYLQALQQAYYSISPIF